MLREILKDCMNSDTLVCLTLDLTDWETIVIGRVKSFDSESLLLDEVNPYGRFIRFNRKFTLSHIKLISYSDIYGKDLKYLIKNQRKEVAKAKYQYLNVYSKSSNDKFSKFLESERIVSLFVNDDYVIGELKRQDSKFVLINNYTYQGFEDGFTLLDKHLITKIRYDGPIENKVEVLRKLKNLKIL